MHVISLSARSFSVLTRNPVSIFIIFKLFLKMSYNTASSLFASVDLQFRRLYFSFSLSLSTLDLFKAIEMKRNRIKKEKAVARLRVVLGC